MTKKKEIYQKLKNNPKNVRFEELCKAAELFGFRYRGGKGSHRIFVRERLRDPELPECERQGKTVSERQLLKMIEKHT